MIQRVSTPDDKRELYQSPLPNIEDFDSISGPIVLINLHFKPRFKLLGFGDEDEIQTILIPNKVRSKIVGVFEYWIRDDQYGVMSNNELISLVDSALSFMDNNIKVVVNCAQGASRSTYIVLAILMKMYYTSYRDTLDYLKSIRPSICPNSYFKDHLISMEDRLLW